jgi:microcystin-dependent protein
MHYHHHHHHHHRRGNNRNVFHLSVIRGRVSKQVTNGSEIAVMDVMGFLYVSLGSSTVQLHGSRACACSDAELSSQNGDHA